MTDPHSTDVPHRPRWGRPVDLELTRRLLEGAIDQVGQHGHRAFTFSALAEAANAGKAAIYRRWSTSSQLIADALALEPLIPAIECRGALRDDLVDLFWAWPKQLSRYELAAAAVLGPSQHDETIRRALHHCVVAPLRERVISVCAAHSALGHADISHQRQETLTRMVRALWWARYSGWNMTGMTTADDVVERGLVPFLGLP